MCGQCCRSIYLEESVHQRILNVVEEENEDLPFIRENFIFTGEKKKYHSGIGFVGESYIYSCKLITNDNKCGIHENKPRICSGYPWYQHGKQAYNSQPVEYKGCGYEIDHYEMRLLRVLYRRKELLEKGE